MRDVFGNKDLTYLDAYDPLAETGLLKASIYPSSQGKDPVLIQTFYPVTEADGFVSLEARIRMVESDFYRVRV